MTRAMNSRTQRTRFYYPGDLVYFWRRQNKAVQGHKTGGFIGPARILATETKREADGSLSRGSSVWCVRGRRLIKCTVEQLRPATRREHLVHELSLENPDKTVPWTFPRVAAELGGNEYEDLTDDVPEEQEWEDSQDPTQRIPVQQKNSPHISTHQQETFSPRSY